MSSVGSLSPISSMSSSPMTSMPIVESQGISIEIIHLPQKGVTAWLDAVNRKQKRTHFLQKLKNVVF
jgi:hypothetical protein